jgi:hypothetical protein
MSDNKPDPIRILIIMKDNDQTPYDAMKMSRSYHDRTGESHDWHEFSNALLSLYNAGLIQYMGQHNGGLCQYKSIIKNQEGG